MGKGTRKREEIVRNEGGVAAVGITRIRLSLDLERPTFRFTSVEADFRMAE